MLNFKKINRLWTSFSMKEKFMALLFIILTTISFVKAMSWILDRVTQWKPAIGGTLNYGTWGSPKNLNPIVSQNSDSEQELINMIYSGLIEENGQGSFENDLAEDIVINETKTIYEIYLKDNIYFQDGVKLTADDVVFTISLMKNYDYKSPYFSLFKDIKAEKLGELMVKITVPISQSNFYNYLGFKIIPKHLWGSITADQFATHELNIKPIGSGPYMISKVEKNKTGNIINIALKRHKKYFKNTFIDKINVRFFDSSEDAFVAFVKGNIDMIKELTPYQKDLIHKKNRIQLNHLKLPRYYAVFLNQKNPLLANSKISEILDLATNKQNIIDTVFFGDAELLNVPISSSFIGYISDLNKNLYDLNLAKSKLNDLGYIDKDGDGILEKWNGKTKTDLEFSLLLPSNNELIHLADMIKKDWEQLGARINLQIVPLQELYKDYLKTRNYDALLFGETYTINPDLYYFWHSSQVDNLGLNLSIYKNAAVDAILEINHTTSEKSQIEKNLKELQELLFLDRPAIFLNNPNYISAYYKKLKIGGDQIYNSFSSSLTNIDQWYINQNRSFK